MTSPNELLQYQQLALVGEARLAIARSKLADAEHEFRRCDSAVADAMTKTGEAYQNWESSIGSAMLGPRNLEALATRLIAAESQLDETKMQLEAVTRGVDVAARALQAAEVHVNEDRKRSYMLARRHRARVGERAQREIAELIQARKGGDQ